MVSRSYSVTFEGIEARLVEIQCAITPGLPSFRIVYTIKFIATLRVNFIRPLRNGWLYY